MIRSLRNRHRVMFMVLTPVCALVMVLAVAARKPVPTMPKIPDALTTPVPSNPKVVFEKSVALEHTNIQVRGLAGEEAILELTVTQDPKKPDLLVYWTIGPAGKVTTPPKTAILLGAMAGVQQRRFKAPTTATLRPGSLIFYSLPHEEVIGTMAIPTITGE